MLRSLVVVFIALSLAPIVYAQGPDDKPVWNVTLKADTSANSTITAQNRCKGTHTFEIKPVNVPFLEIPQREVKVKGGKDKTVPVRFNTAGLAPDTYKGEVVVICKTCAREPTCSQDRETLPVVLTVPGANEKTPSGGEKKKNPYSGYNFQVVIDGIGDDGKEVRGSFTEVSGLDLEPDPIEYRNGSEDITPSKMPGIPKYANITLKRGTIGDLIFWNWIVESSNGNAPRKAGSIRLLNEDQKEVMRWNFRRGWPCKWTGPGLNAAGNEVAIETLEICNEAVDK